jgi:hypothetical protein
MTDASLPTYFQIDGAPGLRMFRCARLRATISDRACAANFLRSQKLRPDQITSTHLCRDCPLGAHHAGVPLVRRSGLHGLSICPRCRRHSERIIDGLRCISCYNREREWVVGANAKGTPPTMAPLRPRRIRIVLNGQATELRAERTRDTAEMVLGVLRVGEGRVTFTRPRRGRAASLAEWIAARRPNCRDQHRAPRKEVPEASRRLATNQRADGAVAEGRAA